MNQKNALSRVIVEYHILQSLPVNCQNRDMSGRPKTCFHGGFERLRRSSQNAKRTCRMTMHENFDLRIGIRTKQVADLLKEAMLGDGAPEDAAGQCAEVIAAALSKDTLTFLSEAEVKRIAAWARARDYKLAGPAATGAEEGKAGKKAKKAKAEFDAKALCKECLMAGYQAVDGLDIALFGRMVAQLPEINVTAAASFSHSMTTHASKPDFDFFTAVDDRPGGEVQSAHLGRAEFGTGTFYQYVTVDLGKLYENLNGNDVDKAIEIFTKALYMSIPMARQSGMASACLWDHARVLVRKGPRMQLSFEEPVKSRGEGFLKPSIEEMNRLLNGNEQRCGSLYGKICDVTFGGENEISIDEVCQQVLDAIHKAGQ